MVVWILILIGFVIGFFVDGYFFKILKSSLDDLSKPPVFGNWKIMFTDGLKVYLVSFVYCLPAILIIIYFIQGSFDYIVNYLSMMGMDLNYLLSGLFESKIGVMFLNFMSVLGESNYDSGRINCFYWDSVYGGSCTPIFYGSGTYGKLRW
ncbi:MAG: DUF4013 domain-containing protein [Methanobacterium formicicum]